jgi:hypothetical protein
VKEMVKERENDRGERLRDGVRVSAYNQNRGRKGRG